MKVHYIASSATCKGKAKLRRCVHWKNFCGRPWMHWFDLILGSQNVVLFGSILLSHSKTINIKVVSFLNLYTKRSNQKALQF